MKNETLQHTETPMADNRVLGAVNINQVDKNMLPCPFCGGKAGIICDDDNGDLNFIIVGCIEKSMLCPNPRMVIYNHDNLGYDLKYWNRRFNCA